MILECATVTGALLGAYLAGLIPQVVLEFLFALMMLQSVYFSLSKQTDDLVRTGDHWCSWLRLGGEIANADGTTSHYGVVHLPWGAGLMVVAGLMSGLLGVGAGALKVAAMDYLMHLPLKVSSATSNFMIGVTAGAGALVFLARGDVSTAVAAPVALGVTVGALAGSRILPQANVGALRLLFAAILIMIAVEMAWRAFTGI
jgi:uncharacterized membrane protein YfcA